MLALRLPTLGSLPPHGSKFYRWSFVALFGICASIDSVPCQGAEEPGAAEGLGSVSFSKQIQPILAKRCFSCHGPDSAEGGLRLSDPESALSETDSGGFAIVPREIDQSELIARITSDVESERMPPEGEPLGETEIGLLRAWIASGAKWEKHWAFESRTTPQPPTVAIQGWNEHPIDAFIAKRLEDRGLTPNPETDRRTLVRRAYLDLWGLPPTLQQTEAFVADPRPDAWERLIDQLLESPHYGERWGRHWLDLVRYAETNSFERDGAKPNAWKYRDYVIRSLNEDKPYDQFVREQLAGDELDEVTEETLTATGYYRLGIWDDEPADRLLAKYDEWDDLMTTTGQVFLGLTINCARCHDHKIDPIPQAEYYSMLAYFADVTSYGGQNENQIEISPPDVRTKYQRYDQRERELNDLLRTIEQEGIVKMSAPDQRATEGGQREKVLRDKLQDNLSEQRWMEYAQLKKEREEIREQRGKLPPREFLLGLARCDTGAQPMRIMLRGNPHVPGEVVEPAIPELFGTPSPELTPPEPGAKSLGRRKALADWIVSPENRLTSRVLANRLWQFHFGRGIVRSTNNFGQLGDPPTHPLLLDYLAQKLIDEGWRLKSMHRLMMTSRAYRMSSLINQKSMEVDPANDLFWRYEPRRMSAEEVRDGILVASGALNPQMYGPSIYPKLSQEVLSGQSRPGSGWGNSSEEQRNRRSVYIHVKRSLLSPLLSAFDYPEPDRTCEARFTTLQPGQALALMNSDFIEEQSSRLAKRVVESAGSSRTDQIDQAIRFVLGRGATETEAREALALLDEMEQDFGLSSESALQMYCLTVLNWNEFMFVD